MRWSIRVPQNIRWYPKSFRMFIGLKNEKLVLKSDQEKAVKDVMRSIARERSSDYGTALEQSAVG